MAAQTFAQKALARAAGLDFVEVGQVVDARPDVVLSHDNTAAIRRIWQEFGQDRVLIPERIAITLDHAVPAPTTKHAQNHAEIRQFVQEQGIRHFFEVGRGICHQVLSEEALILPGQLILGADSHTTHYGWLGAFGAGIGRSEVATLWATGELWLRVPESMKIVLEGDLPPGVTAKDFALRVIGDLGADGGLYQSVEFHGSGIAAMSLESRMVLPNMMAEFGAKNAWVAPDEKTVAYLKKGLKRRLGDYAIERFGDDEIAANHPIAQSHNPLISQFLLPDAGAPRDPAPRAAGRHRRHGARASADRRRHGQGGDDPLRAARLSRGGARRDAAIQVQRARRHAGGAGVPVPHRVKLRATLIPRLLRHAGEGAGSATRQFCFSRPRRCLRAAGRRRRPSRAACAAACGRRW